MNKLLYAASLALLYAVAALAAAPVPGASTSSPKKDIASNITIFNAVVKELQSNYVDTINMEHAVQTALDAMLDELDPYTVYMPRSDQEDFRALNSGEYAGIGSTIMQRDGNVYISEPYLGSPAAKGGLKPGDLIIAVDTLDALGKPTTLVSERLRGPRGTTVRIKVGRPYLPADTDSVMTFDIVREKIHIPAVPYYGLVGQDNHTGYIQLQQFSEKSSDEFAQALDTLLSAGINSLIVDLRGNGGGYLESAVRILGHFLPKGTEVLRTRGRDVVSEKVYKTTTRPNALNLPLVVLTDGGTASASEITAGALQDLDRAVIIGSRSFGKGLVQTSREIPYDGLLKVTIARYYIPSGRCIQAIDYSHRNADGSVARTPDSLTTAYLTAHGRTVRDGGGITPDITVKLPDVSRLTYNAVADNWVFDFANRYAAANHQAPALEEFVVTDSIYSMFKQSIDPRRFNYDRVCESMIADLRKAAQIEGYESDSLTQQFDRLEAMMKHPLERDLDVNREALAPIIQREIVGRYYYRPGEVYTFLRYDPVVKEAIEVLAQRSRYNDLLATPAKPKKVGK